MKSFQRLFWFSVVDRSIGNFLIFNLVSIMAFVVMPLYLSFISLFELYFKTI